MKNREKWFEVVKELRVDSARKQKRGLHFIITSVFIWVAIFVIHSTNMSILTKNFLTLCCSAPLMPLALLVSKIIKVDFQNKENPLTNLGIIFSVNQMLYILIAMWIYAGVPDKMVMVYAMIFGAHLLPYGWLYRSMTYYVFAVLIPIVVLGVGVYYPASVVAGMMIVFEVIFCICLILEVQMDSKEKAHRI